MREHILITVIALTGMAGLLSIHKDVKAERNMQFHLSSYLPVAINASVARSPGTEEPAFSIRHEPGDSFFLVELTQFDPDAHYELEYGRDQRHLLLDPNCLLRVTKDGNRLLKLFCDRQLLAASEAP